MKINWTDNLLFGAGTFIIISIFCSIYEACIITGGAFIIITAIDFFSNL